MKNVKAVLIALLISSPLFVIVGVWCPQMYIIYGQSMEPNFHEGDHSLVLERNFNINRFDVVIVASEKTALIKRVIGLPGETLEYVDGNLTINGVAIEEPFLPDFRMNLIHRSSKFQLKDNQYFVMGDNRTNSHDSRAFGPVSRNRILGKVYYRW